MQAPAVYRAPYAYRVWPGTFFRAIQRSLARELRAHAPHGAVVVDLGCGPGAVTAAVARTRPDLRVIALDPSEAMCRHVRMRARSSAAVVCGRAEALPFADGSVHFLVSSMAYHHWTPRSRGVAEVLRVLAPDGQARFVHLPGEIESLVAELRARDVATEPFRPGGPLTGLTYAGVSLRLRPAA